MIAPILDPVALNLGHLQVRWYGLMYLAGFALGWILGRRRAAKPGSGWTAADVDDLGLRLLSSDAWGNGFLESSA